MSISTSIDARAREEVLLDIGKLPAECTIGHKGPLLDFGDPTLAKAKVRGTKDQRPDAQQAEFEGATWLKVTGREVRLPFRSFDAVTAGQPLGVHLRLRGGAARAASVVVNGKGVGAISLQKGVVSIAGFKSTTAALLEGDNELVLRFTGVGKSNDVAAEVDWAHVGPLDAEDGPYAAPTRQDALGTVTLKQGPRQAVSLRAPGYVRCSMYTARDARVRGRLGVQGKGQVELELRLHRDRQPSAVLGHYRLESEADWTSIDLPLPVEGAGLAELEVAVLTAPKGVRAAVADMRVVLDGARAAASKVTPRAESAVIVLLGSTPPKSISVYGGTIELPELGALAASGLVFERHRAVTPQAAGNVASLFTGTEADEHRVTDAFTKLPSALPTLADCAREAGLLTAFFTANPETSEAYGFRRGFATYQFADPTDLGLATRVFDDAADWVTRHRDSRFLLVVHARGGHPPWDASATQLREMPPPNYTGGLEPRRAGEYLARVRSTKGARFTDAERTRLWGLYALALATHDAALGRFLNTLRSLDRDRDTAIWVASDTGLDVGAKIPFGENDLSSEEGLASTLVMRGPGRASPALTGRVAVPTTAVDLGVSVLGALGLTPPRSFRGRNLWELSADPHAPPVRVAWSGRGFAASWENFVMYGGDAPTRLCDLSLDPACATDVRAQYPITYARMSADVSRRAETVASLPKEAPSIDAATQNALRAWGRGR